MARSKTFASSKVRELVVPPTMDRRLTIRIGSSDYKKLCQLQLALHAPSPAETLRILVRMHWSVEQAAIHKLERDPLYGARVQKLLGGGPLAYFQEVEEQARKAAKK